MSRSMLAFSVWHFPTTCCQPTVLSSQISPALSVWHHYPLNMASCDRNTRSLTRVKDKLLRRDRQLSLERCALRAARAFGVPHLQECQIAFRVRWRQHHAEMLSAKIVSSPCGLCPWAVPPPEGDADMAQVWRPSCAAVSNLLARVDGNRALDLDVISAVVLRAGGHNVVQHLRDIISASLSVCQFPIPWRGVRCVNLDKKQGDFKDCNFWRGLHVGDHARKSLSAIASQMCEVWSARINLFGANTTDGSYTCRSYSAFFFWMSHACLIIAQQSRTWICPM